MKIALICPSNMLYMPYVRNYLEILDSNGIDYDVINWDRFDIEEKNKFVYRDSKIGHRRGIIDYFKYSKFILRILKINKYDKVIVFGIQLIYFLKRYLLNEYKDKYIVDIRDYNKIIKFLDMKRIIENSAFTVLSSPGYKQWLPNTDKYIINHNTNIARLDQLSKINNNNLSKSKIDIGCIGAIRDYQVNIDFIDALKNCNKIEINFHGEGEINKNILEYINNNNIKNVNITGRYEQHEEESLYNRNDIINVLRYNDSINNKTALPNRLYNSVINGKPMLAFEGTQLAEIVERFNLGIVINTFKNLSVDIDEYLNKFDKEKYNESRINFIKLVINDNIKFNKYIKKFVFNK